MENFPHIRYKSDMETNVTTITKKILSHQGNPMKVDDMLRASIYLNSEEDMKNVYILFIRSIVEQSAPVWQSKILLH